MTPPPKRSTSTNNWLPKLAAGLAFALSQLWLLPVQADYKPYAWVLNIETEQLPGHFQYQGSILQPAVLARVTCTRSDGSDYTTPYETLWFCNGKPYGLDRINQLNFTPGQGIQIRISHKSVVPSDYELKAAAKTIVRTFLDIRTNNCMVQNVVVPDVSFIGILNAMGNDHFSVFNVPLDRPYQISALMFIHDESGQQKQTVCYAPNSAGAVGMGN